MGYLGVAIHLATELNSKGKPYKSDLYRVWESMIRRCYGKKALEHNPTYLDKIVNNTWQCFQWFGDWCVQAKGYGIKGWELDKDVVVKGNKEYSPDTTFFVPKVINNLLLNAKKARGELPLGVTTRDDGRKDIYMAQCCVNGGRIRGSFANPDSAFLWYKQTKETEIKRLAELYKQEIDIKVYNALMNYTVETTD